ncbi:MAG: MFS transporter [Bacillaceae bacterium]|nr:MFS transporter [Bacillaceae bacterium]
MRNKFFYLLGSAINNLGDGFQSVALMWLVLKLTGSPLSLGILIAINYLPPLFFAPWVGIITDHQDSKVLTVAVQLIRGLAVSIVVLLIFIDTISIVMFYLLQVVLAVCHLVFKPSSQTLIRESFSDEEMVYVISKSSSINFVMALIGTGIAGIVMSILSVEICFAINALTFMVSSIFFILLRRIDRRNIQSKSMDVIEGIKVGWKFVNEKRGMLYLFFLATISSAGYQMTNTLLAPMVARDMKGSSVLFSIITISFTLGGSLGGFVVEKALYKYKEKVSVVTLVGLVVFSLFMGIDGYVWFTVFALFGFGFFILFHVISMQTLVQINTPKELMGRVISFRSIVVSFAKISSALLSGYLAGIMNTHYVFLGFMGLCLLSLLSLPKVEHIPLPDSIKYNSKLDMK